MVLSSESGHSCPDISIGSFRQKMDKSVHPPALPEHDAPLQRGFRDKREPYKSRIQTVGTALVAGRRTSARWLRSIARKSPDCFQSGLCLNMCCVVNGRNLRGYIMPPIPPMPPMPPMSGMPAGAPPSSGASVIMHSVVRSRPATEPAF